MKKKYRYIFSLLGIGLLLVGLVWWFYPRYKPTAYVGVREVARTGSRTKYKFPSYIVKVDLKAGTVVDTFPLSENVPIIRDIAVDWKRQKLYAVGDPNTDYEHLKTTSGIDMYDLKTQKMIDRIDFKTDRARIRHIRFNPTYDYLFVDNPLSKDDRPAGEKQKMTWVLNPVSGRLIFTTEARISYRDYYSLNGQFKYYFWPAMKFKSLNDVEQGKLIFSYQQESKLVEIEGYERLKKVGGWQPDPEGKYETDPYVLDYPQVWGQNPLEFYKRETLEKIGTLDMEGENEEMTGGAAGWRETVTKDNKYLVSTVSIREPGSNKRPEQYLKVIDLENYEVLHTIYLGPLITNVDAY